MKSLFELLVEALDDKTAEQELRAAFQSTSVEGFLEKFRNIASDPTVQAILKAGVTDGRPDDEKIRYSIVTVKVSNLIPTQDEIGFDQSIAGALSDKYGMLGSIIQGGVSADKPIIIYNSKYIIDGHHRWSQAYTINPGASMKAVNLIGDLTPAQVLKVMHAAIAVDTGKVPSSNPKGINILKGVSLQQIADKTNQLLTDKARSEYKKIGLDTDEEIIQYLYTNLQRLIKNNTPIPDAPGRKDMPQTDAGNTTSVHKIDAIAKGVINFIKPRSADVK